MKAEALGGAAHALLLAAPVVLAGRGARLAEPCALATLALLVLFSVAEGGAARDVDGGDALGYASGIVLLLLGWSVLASPHRAAACIVGGPVVLAGIELRVRAIAALGDGFTSRITPGPRLVTGGIYGRLRHPSELGLLLVALGLVVLGGALLPAALGAAALAAISGIRVVREERALSAGFGDRHARYCRAVGIFRAPTRRPAGGRRAGHEKERGPGPRNVNRPPGVRPLGEGNS